MILKNKNSRVYNQILATIVLTVAGTIGICWLLNSRFLGFFYMDHKTTVIKNVFNTLNEAADKEYLYKKWYRSTFEEICVNDNLSILVMAPDRTTQLSSAGENSSDSMRISLMESILRSDISEHAILDSGSNYLVERQKDRNMNGEFLVLTGNLDDGNTIMIRTAVNSIKDSADVSNKFLLIAGLISIIISFFIAIVLTSRITKPVMELTDISRKMTGLDFNARYKPRKHSNEIDDLGVHMNKMADKLEETIKELKQANTDLQHDIDIREKSESMRKDFLSNVSHELKTPIALIQGYAEGLEDGVSSNPDDMKYYCDVIMDEAKKMNHMVHQMLDLNQLEFGQKNVEMDHFDLVPIIDGLLRNSQILIDQNGIAVEFNIKGPVNVWADEFFTEQAINNYLTNAIHYALYDKKIIIYITGAENNGVRVNVFNTGDHIPDESIPHLWEKFYKVDKARTREYGGSGIGLSFVKAVMDSFHRKCGVENVPGGVNFWLELDKG